MTDSAEQGGETPARRRSRTGLLLALLPVAAFVVIGVFLFRGLSLDPSEIYSVLINKPAPAFELAPLPGKDNGLATSDLTQPVQLVNVFASWCVPCRAEHKVLTRLAAQEGFPLFGINYKDKPEDAKAWLEELGNPYLRIGSDESGRSGLEWGISGVPESFLIDGTGTVIWRYVGPIVTEQAQDDLRRALAATRERAAS